MADPLTIEPEAYPSWQRLGFRPISWSARMSLAVAEGMAEYGLLRGDLPLRAACAVEETALPELHPLTSMASCR